MKSPLLLISLLACAWTANAAAGLEQTLNDLLPQLAVAPAKGSPSAEAQLEQLAAQAGRPGAESDRLVLARLLMLKATDASVPHATRVWLLRQVERIGAAESVPGLTTLLNGHDAELRECARRALERNAAPAAVDSLRVALEKGGDQIWKTGLIHSLGERADAASVKLIAANLSDAALSTAAASALGKIATPAARRKLWVAYRSGNVPAGQALAAAAGRLAGTGATEAAKELYKSLYAFDGDLRVRLAALAGLAKTDPEDTRLRIDPLLRSEDLKLRSAALAAAADIYGAGAPRVLAQVLPELGDPAQEQVLPLLDASGEPQTLAAAANTNLAVRLAAVEALGRFGGAAAVPLLLPWAAGDSSKLQKAAAAALIRAPGHGVGEALVRQAGEGEMRLRCAAIKALAGRGDRTLISRWLDYAGEPEPALRAASCDALAQLGGEAEFNALMPLALKGASPAATAARQIAGRITNKTDITAQLVAQSRNAEPGPLATLFGILSVVGGAEALDAIAQATTNANDAIRDVAIRALADWSDFAAAKPLLAVAADPQTKEIHNTLAIEAVVRLVTGSDEKSTTPRLDAAVGALNAARRVEEKRLALSAIGGIPNAKGGEAIKPYLADPELKTEAGLAQAALAESLPVTEKVAAMDLARTLKDAQISETLTRRAEALLNKLVPQLPP